MSQAALEAFFARVLTDDELLREFLRDPVETGRRAGLPGEVAEGLASADLEGVEMQARSLGYKRAAKAKAKGAQGGALARWWARARRALGVKIC